MANWFDPHKSFLGLKIVWVTVCTLLLISAISSIIIIVYSDLNLDLTFLGFNFFISVFRFPLAIATLIIPIVALLAANHRSEQTKEQIRVTNNQNVFSNYYKHIEEFTRYLVDRVDNKIDLRFAHSNIYPDAPIGDYRINDKLISLIVEINHIPLDLLSCKPKEINAPLEEETRGKYYLKIRELYDFLYRNEEEYSEYITHYTRDQ